MDITRREVMRAGVAVFGTAIMGRAAVSAGGAGTPVNGAAHAPRMPLSEFVKSDRLLAALRKGVAAMKARPGYDPLSWFYQAAIHGVPPEMVNAERARLAALDDKNGTHEADKLDAVFQKRYWN